MRCSNTPNDASDDGSNARCSSQNWLTHHWVWHNASCHITSMGQTIAHVWTASQNEHQLTSLHETNTKKTYTTTTSLDMTHMLAADPKARSTWLPSTTSSPTHHMTQSQHDRSSDHPCSQHWMMTCDNHVTHWTVTNDTIGHTIMPLTYHHNDH